MVSFTSVCDGSTAGLQRNRGKLLRNHCLVRAQNIYSSISRREFMVGTGTHRVQKEAPIMAPRRDLGGQRF